MGLIGSVVRERALTRVRVCSGVFGCVQVRGQVCGVVCGRGARVQGTRARGVFRCVFGCVVVKCLVRAYCAIGCVQACVQVRYPPVHRAAFSFVSDYHCVRFVLRCLLGVPCPKLGGAVLALNALWRVVPGWWFVTGVSFILRRPSGVPCPKLGGAVLVLNALWRVVPGWWV